MEQMLKEMITASVKDFKLPRYNEIPNVGLYLEQVTKYVSEYLAPLEGITITSSMISNYVKKKLIANPVRKMYDRDQIAYILFVAAAKSVLSLEDIQELFLLQQQSYDVKTAYSYFCRHFEATLFAVFGLCQDQQEKEQEADIPKDGAGQVQDERTLLARLVMTIANKIYLDTYFASLARLREGKTDTK